MCEREIEKGKEKKEKETEKEKRHDMSTEGTILLQKSPTK